MLLTAITEHIYTSEEKLLFGSSSANISWECQAQISGLKITTPKNFVWQIGGAFVELNRLA